MNLKWNEVTWYSRILTLVFLVGIVPVIMFYIGTVYQKTISISITNIPITQPILESKVITTTIVPGILTVPAKYNDGIELKITIGNYDTSDSERMKLWQTLKSKIIKDIHPCDFLGDTKTCEEKTLLKYCKPLKSEWFTNTSPVDLYNAVWRADQKEFRWVVEC